MSTKSSKVTRILILTGFLANVALYENCGQSNGGAAFGIVMGGQSGNLSGSSTNPLVLTFSTPTNNSNISTVTPVTVTIVDPYFVTSVQFQVDGANSGGPVIAAPYTLSFNPGLVPSGVHTITATAMDSGGNVGSATLTVLTGSGTNPQPTPAPTPVPNPTPFPLPTVLSCGGSFLVSTSNGFRNVPMNISENPSTGTLTGTMVFPGFSTFSISGNCASSSNSSGTINFVRTLNGGSPLSWTGTYTPSSSGQINITGKFGNGSYGWSAVSQ